MKERQAAPYTMYERPNAISTLRLWAFGISQHSASSAPVHAQKSEIALRMVAAYVMTPPSKLIKYMPSQTEGADTIMPIEDNNNNK